MPVIIADRVVEVLCDLGPHAAQRWIAGSGFLITESLVLTAAHVVANGDITVRQLSPGSFAAKTAWPARVLLSADHRVADLALVELESSGADLDPVGFVRVDRHRAGAASIAGCRAVGFPQFKTFDLEDLTGIRETAQVDGVIPLGEDLHSELLTLRLTSTPRRLEATAEHNGRSPWSGMSGAAVLAGDRVIGIVAEHRPASGESALVLTPITRLADLPDEQAEAWWAALKVDPANFPVVPAASDAPAPMMIGTVPPVSEYRQPRRQETELTSALTTRRTAVVTPVVAGMSGIGKTQLAAWYARTAWRSGDLDVLLWVAAASRESVVNRYVDAYAAVTGTRGETADEAAMGLVRWLATTDQRWLVVLDDVGDPTSLRDLWPQTPPHGRVLATTARRDAATIGAPGRTIVEVGLFRPDEAVGCLRLALGQRAGHEDEAVRLAAELGLLPLAVQQAAAYMRDQELGYDEYQLLFTERRSLLDETIVVPTVLDDPHAPVFTTLSLSMDLADAIGPTGLGRPLLELAGSAGSAGTPATAFRAPSALAFLRQRRNRGATGVTGEEVDEVLRRLHRLGLLSIGGSAAQPIVFVHDLVRRSVRDTVTPGWLARATRAISEALLADPVPHRGGTLLTPWDLAVRFHPDDEHWAAWIADELTEQGASVVLQPLPDPVVPSTVRTVLVLSRQLARNLPAGSADTGALVVRVDDTPAPDDLAGLGTADVFDADETEAGRRLADLVRQGVRNRPGGGRMRAAFPGRDRPGPRAEAAVAQPKPNPLASFRFERTTVRDGTLTTIVEVYQDDLVLRLLQKLQESP